MKKIELHGKMVLVTGGSGFLGTPLIKRLLDDGVRVRTICRDEGKLIELKQKFPSIEIYTGDVSDKFEVKQAMKGVSGVFHLAASKHVGLAEKHVRECIKSNTIGSLNILEESLEMDLEFVIGISTDKAAQVAGVYGASKLLMERLFKQFEELNNKCEYRIVRYGNVLYSTGSVLCKWKKLIEEGKEVIVTDLEATRFFWTVDHALDLIFDCLYKWDDCTPYVPEMKGMSLSRLLEAMISKYSKNGIRSFVKEIGLQAGENKHERVLENGPTSEEVDQYTVEEIKKLI
jgi:UDP-N-acetylglucosamine 4,6-dehydratase/UDP-glucose 4-epimerase